MIIILAAKISLLYQSVNDLREMMAYAVNGGQWCAVGCTEDLKDW